MMLSMDRMAARRIAESAFPRGHLRVLLAVGILTLLYGAIAQRTLEMALPRAGCLSTLAAAMCEWRMLYWRIEVEVAARELDKREFRDRQAMQVHRVQVANTARWVHLLFFVSTICWGFGDLLWQ
jgi:hypothetical protein